MDTSGFYKIIDNETSQMAMGPNFVLGPQDSFELRREQKDIYIYPTDGWYWFDSHEEACIYFNIPYPPEIPTMGLPLNLEITTE
jgi:hypothetical protein